MITGLITLDIVAKINGINIDIRSVVRQYALDDEIEIEKLQLIAKNFDFKTRIKNLPLEDMEKYPPSCNYS